MKRWRLPISTERVLTEHLNSAYRRRRRANLGRRRRALALGPDMKRNLTSKTEYAHMPCAEAGMCCSSRLLQYHLCAHAHLCFEIGCFAYHLLLRMVPVPQTLPHQVLH